MLDLWTTAMLYFRPMVTKKHDPVVVKARETAVAEAGGPAELARFITEQYEPITAQAICDWDVVPPRRVLQVERAVKAKGGKTRRHDMCPSLYPRERAA